MKSPHGQNNESFCSLETNLNYDKIEDENKSQSYCNASFSVEKELEKTNNSHSTKNTNSCMIHQGNNAAHTQSLVPQKGTNSNESRIVFADNTLTRSEKSDNAHNKVQVTVSIDTYKKIFRQLSHTNSMKGRKFTQINKSTKVPKNYNDLAIFTCFCCLSPFGFAALIFSALSTISYTDGDQLSAMKYSKLTLTLSIVGILVNFLIVLLVIFTKGFSVT